MTNGNIVYVVGDDRGLPEAELNAAARRLMPEADQIALVSRRAGHMDVMDAWHALTVRGMGRIVCTACELTPGGELRTTGQPLRLCG